MSDQRKIAVTVGGQSFYLKTDHDDAYLLDLADTIDKGKYGKPRIDS